MSAAHLKCATITGTKRPAPPPSAPTRATPQLPTSNMLSPEEIAAAPEATAVYLRMLEEEKRIDFAVGEARGALEAALQLTPTESLATPLPAMACAPRHITQSLRLVVSMQLDEAAIAPAIGGAGLLAARWNVQLAAYLSEKGGGGGAEPVELEQYLSSVRLEVNCEPKVVADCSARGNSALSMSKAKVLSLSRTSAFPASRTLELRVSLVPKQPPPTAFEQRVTLSAPLAQVLGVPPKSSFVYREVVELVWAAIKQSGVQDAPHRPHGNSAADRGKVLRPECALLKLLRASPEMTITQLMPAVRQHLASDTAPQVLVLQARVGHPVTVSTDLCVSVLDPLHDARRGALQRFLHHGRMVARLHADHLPTLHKLRGCLSKLAWLQALMYESHSDGEESDGELRALKKPRAVDDFARALVTTRQHCVTHGLTLATLRTPGGGDALAPGMAQAVHAYLANQAAHPAQTKHS